MFNRGGNDEFNLHSISFLTVALILTIFSVAYGDWYYSSITGLAPGGPIPPDNPPSLPSSSDSSPPSQVVQEVSDGAEIVNEGASYASNVGTLIESNPNIAESDLTRYLSNLLGTKAKALEIYKKSSVYSEKYSSSSLDKYHESIVEDFASIDRRIREINSILTESVTERFEKQTEQAVWIINHEEEVEISRDVLSEYNSLLFPLTPNEGFFNSEFQRQPTFNLVLQRPSKLVIDRGSQQSAQITLTNEGLNPVNNCMLTIIPSTIETELVDWISFPQGNFITYLGPSRSQSFIFNIAVPQSTPGGTYFFNFRVGCDEAGATAGITYHFDVLYSYEELLNIFYQNHVLPNLDYGLYGALGMPEECYNNIQSCYVSQTSCSTDILSCVYDNECTNFINSCFGSPIILYSSEQYDEFLQVYFNSYHTPPQSPFTSQCVEDVGACFEPTNCASYISSCIESHVPGGPAPYECVNFLSECSNNQILSYSERRRNLIQQYVTLYNNIPLSCLSGISACSDPYTCSSSYNYIYNCIIGTELGGSCSEYLANCQGVQTGTTGTGSGGFSGGFAGSESGVVIPVAPGTVAGTSSGGSGSVSPCQDNAVCESLIQTSCVYPSMVAALGLDLVDFGGFGYNPFTGEICYMGQPGVYIRPAELDPDIHPTGQSGNGVNPNSIISIHFQNPSSENSRNYVAAIAFSLNGHLTLGFVSDPTFSGMDEKLREFILNLLYGEGVGSYITGMSLQQAEEIVNQSVSVPWVLWIILFVMVISFVLFGNILSPYNERLISSGKKALNRKDYALAVHNYNTLAISYSDDSNVKQDALEYLKQIRERVGKGKIDLEFYGKNLPKIKAGNFTGIFTNSQRVQKMIEHALSDIKKSPKLAKSRLHIISEEYKRLSPKDKEHLASQYESLVYRLRNIK
ncbi:MAG: hypothetical protein AABX10_02350 [Nanoarchaeota archaeon]